MDYIQQLSILGLVVIAGLLGGLIGVEREFSHKSAGVRTHMFVASSAAALVLIANYLIDYFAFAHPFASFQTDPIRIIQAIVIGFSFIGAGVIFKDIGSANIRNLTTAASIFATTAVGIAVAVGLIYFAIGITLFVIIVNLLIMKVEKNLVPKEYTRE